MTDAKDHLRMVISISYVTEKKKLQMETISNKICLQEICIDIFEKMNKIHCYSKYKSLDYNVALGLAQFHAYLRTGFHLLIKDLNDAQLENNS